MRPEPKDKFDWLHYGWYSFLDEKGIDADELEGFDKAAFDLLRSAWLDGADAAIKWFQTRA